MQASDTLTPQLRDHCTQVLEAYLIRDAASRSASPDYSGWLDRITRMDGLTARDLTSAHGFLIAEGLLRFEITGRSVGLQYQVSTLGRDMLRKANATSEEDEPDARTDVEEPDTRSAA
ncbi:MAG: hypothetical protein KDA96_08470 [Planctomycetaceae bacterium]|nr:hypothetical protein [Planctomycetaceae bacterium]